VILHTDSLRSFSLVRGCEDLWFEPIFVYFVYFVFFLISLLRQHLQHRFREASVLSIVIHRPRLHQVDVFYKTQTNKPSFSNRDEEEKTAGVIVRDTFSYEPQRLIVFVPSYSDSIVGIGVFLQPLIYCFVFERSVVCLLSLSLSLSLPRFLSLSFTFLFLNGVDENSIDDL